MQNEAKADRTRAIAEIAAGDVIASAQIDAPLDRVFAAFTDPHEILHWWGDEAHYRITEWVPSVDPGGRFRAVGVSADGAPFVIDGEYLEVASPHRFSHTWKPDYDHGLITTVSCHLESRAGGTHLTLRHTGFVAHSHAQPHGPQAIESQAGYVKGWPLVLDWLTAYVEGDTE